MSRPLPRRSLQSPSGRRRPGADGGVCSVGHRGARAFAPENTLPAFRKAATLGCSMIELDVHLSRDGELVVHHDDVLTRCTNLKQKFPQRHSDFVSDFSLPELRTLDAGGWYLRELALPAAARQPFLRTLTDAELHAHLSADERAFYASGSVRIPTLDEALALARELDLMVNVEIKTIPRMYPGIADRVVDRVATLGMRRSVLISSFDHEQLVAVRHLDAEIATGVLTSDRLAHVGDYLRLLDADAYHPGCADEFDSLGFDSAAGEPELGNIGQLLDSGAMVFAWTCNQRDRLETLRAAGVTGIITDYPNRLEEVKRGR